MTLCRHHRIFLSFVLFQVMLLPLDAVFTLTFVREHNFLLCTCVQDLEACGSIGSSECDCTSHQLSNRQQGAAPDPMHFKALTVWYTSPLNVARLLNNSEVRHLTLVKCDSAGPKLLPFDYFSVQRLERLTIFYHFWRPDQSRDILLGRDMAAPHHEEARIAIIHVAVLLGKAGLKAYTVKTEMDSDGVIPFPHVFMSSIWLPKESYIFVTFVY